MFNVRQFGALGAGASVDETAAIQAAIDAAAALTGGGRVIVPPGNYLVSNLYIKSHVDFFGSGNSTKFTAKSGTTGAVISNFDADVERCHLGHFWIEGNLSGADVTGVSMNSDGGDWVGADPEIKLSEIMVTNVDNDGFIFTGSRAVRGFRLRVRNPGNDGIAIMPGAIDSTADCSFVDCSSEAAGRDLLHVEGHGNIFTNFKMGGLGATRYGVFCGTLCFDGLFTGIIVDATVTTGWRIEGNANIFNGCGCQNIEGISITLAGTAQDNIFNGFTLGTAGSTYPVLATSGVLRNRVVLSARGTRTADFDPASDLVNNTVIVNANDYSSYGTYTPIIANTANMSASSPRLCQWSRNGKMVHVSGAVDIDPTAGSTFTGYTLTFPIASNITLVTECNGTMGYSTGSVVVNGSIRPEVGANTAVVEFISDAGAASQTHNFQFSYLIK